MANIYTGMESLPLDVVNTIYWMSEVFIYNEEDARVMFANHLALQEMWRRFGNNEQLASEWMESNRPYWAYPGGE